MRNRGAEQGAGRATPRRRARDAAAAWFLRCARQQGRDQPKRPSRQRMKAIAATRIATL
ncbi:hypothetical protein [Lysobacter gummosus]|uniref:hypothetical protein n=1 Tax=Lysobacter gummosus TaxID=262324 RepID=UPI00362EF6D8